MSDTDELKEMKQRRVKGARLLQSGIHPAEVARRVGVSRQSVMRWERRFMRFYFRLFAGAIRSPQIVQFLKVLSKVIGQKLLIIWDRLQAHKSKLVRAFVEQRNGDIALEYLPAYAPELNGVLRI